MHAHALLGETFSQKFLQLDSTRLLSEPAELDWKKKRQLTKRTVEAAA